MKFIEEFDKKYRERNKFIEDKEKQVNNLKIKLEASQKAIEKANKEYFLNMNEEALNHLKKCKKSFKELENQFNEAKEELEQLKGNFLFVYSKDDIYKEVVLMYDRSNIDKEVDKLNKLENELQNLKNSIAEKWFENVEKNTLSVTSKINKLYLTDEERIKLCREIDGFINSKLYKLAENDINVSHRKMHSSELVLNSMKKN